MNKKVFGRKLSRSRPSREALFASLTRSLILNGKIKTTRAKAKAVSGMVEKMVTLAKVGNIAARRNALSQLDNAKDATSVLFSKIVAAFPSKTSGYTRIISLPPRIGDNAQMVRLEWTEKLQVPQVAKVSKVAKETKTKKEPKEIKSKK